MDYFLRNQRLSNIDILRFINFVDLNEELQIGFLKNFPTTHTARNIDIFLKYFPRTHKTLNVGT